MSTDDEDLDEEAALQQALALSQQSTTDDVDMDDHSKPAPAQPVATDMEEDSDEEDAIARAIQMSMQEEEEKKQ